MCVCVCAFVCFSVFLCLLIGYYSLKIYSCWLGKKKPHNWFIQKRIHRKNNDRLSLKINCFIAFQIPGWRQSEKSEKGGERFNLHMFSILFFFHHSTCDYSCFQLYRYQCPKNRLNVPPMYFQCTLDKYNR